MIKGEHVANLFSGQFFFEEPDVSFFKKQAEIHDFEESSYIKALEKVPIISQEKVKTAMNFLLNMTEMISEITLQKLEQIELNEQRKKNEETLRHSEEDLKGSQRIAHVGSWRLDISTNKVSWSDELYKMYGFDPSLPPPPYNEQYKIFTPESWERLSKALPETIKTGTSYELELETLRKDESNGWMWVRGEVVRDVKGTVVGLRGAAQDITERKNVEKALHENEEMMRHSQSVAHICSYSTDLNVNEIEKSSWVCSPEFYKIFGIDETYPHTIDGWANFIHPDYRKEVFDYHESVVKEKKTFSREYKIIRINDGEERWVHGTGKLEFDEKGNPVRMHGAIQDITERKQAERALKKSEELLRSTQELAKVGGWEWNLEKQAMFWTDEVYRIHDFQPDQFKSGTTEHIEASLKCYDPEDLPTIQDAFQKCYEKGIAYDLEYPLTTAKGRRIWVRTVTNPVLNCGKIVKVIGNIIDITDIKNREREKKNLEDQLRQAQRIESIGNLAGGIAHDFNNLLFPIIGMSEMLLEDLPQDSLEHENVQAIFNAGRRAGDLVKQILAFSRQSEHTMTPVRVQNVLKEVLKLSRSTIPANIEIHEAIQQNCGSVMADSTQVHQVAMNLITNAFHAIEGKNGIIDVKLKEITLKNNELPDSLLQAGQYVMLSVSDNGIGMAQGTIHIVFDPYFTTKEKGKGTGLGLSVVYGIIKEHKGEVKVYSEVGKGTTFNIYLPLMIKDAEKGVADQLSQIEIGTENLLLVDDDESIVKLEKLMLERLGYKVTVQTNSVDALTLFEANPESFDLVITDMTMPNMTGDQLAREILLIKPDIPIIICTGFSEQINKEHAETIGVKGFLMKPAVNSEMAQMVRTVLDKAKNS